AASALALAFLLTGRCEEAVEHARKAIEGNQNFAFPYCVLALGCAHLGRREETREAVRRLTGAAPGFRLGTLRKIRFADAARLQPGDEKEHFAGLRSFLTEIIEPLIPEFGGNIFKHTGELVLIEFESVVEAARCAAALRDAALQMNQMLPNERRIAMRIGINLGDIIVEGGDVFGDGVNIAARLEALAEPG